jgi:hypothetical protein
MDGILLDIKLLICVINVHALLIVLAYMLYLSYMMPIL